MAKYNYNFDSYWSDLYGAIGEGYKDGLIDFVNELDGFEPFSRIWNDLSINNNGSIISIIKDVQDAINDAKEKYSKYKNIKYGSKRKEVKEIRQILNDLYVLKDILDKSTDVLFTQENTYINSKKKVTKLINSAYVDLKSITTKYEVKVRQLEGDKSINIDMAKEMFERHLLSPKTTDFKSMEDFIYKIYTPIIDITGKKGFINRIENEQLKEVIQSNLPNRYKETSFINSVYPDSLFIRDILKAVQKGLNFVNKEYKKSISVQEKKALIRDLRTLELIVSSAKEVLPKFANMFRQNTYYLIQDTAMDLFRLEVGIQKDIDEGYKQDNINNHILVK